MSTNHFYNEISSINSLLTIDGSDLKCKVKSTAHQTVK